MTVPRNKLPKKMSELIVVALADLAKVERQTTTYRVNMKTWHEPNSHCAVCLAGAVMAKTFGLDPTINATPECLRVRLQVSDSDVRGLFALNQLRVGNVNRAADNMGLSDTAMRKAMHLNRDMPDYYRGVAARKFKTAMRSLAKDLRKAGL